VQTKLDALLALSKLQSDVFGLFVRAQEVKATGDYEAAHAAFGHYIASGREYLAASLSFNSQFPADRQSVVEIVRGVVNALMVDADIVHALGDRAAAEALRQEALGLSRAHFTRRGAADTERSSAALLMLEGRFNEAIVALMNARDVVLEADDKIAAARVAIDLADVFQWLGDFRRAKEEIDHAASLIEPFVGAHGVTQSDILAGVLASVSSIMAGKGDSGNATRNADLYRAFTEVTYYRGLIAKSLGEWDEAERHFLTVLPEYRSLRAGEAVEFQLAHVKLGRGQYEQALEQARGFAAAFERGAFRPKRAVFQRLVAECVNALGDRASAQKLAELSVEDLEQRHFDPDALWRSQRVLARIASDRGDRRRALEALRAAIGTIGGLRRAPLGYRLDSTYLSDKTGVYSQAIAEAVAADEPGDCCAFIEGIKSRTLAAVLSVPSSGGGNEWSRQFDALTLKLDALEYKTYREGWTAQERSAQPVLLKQRADLLERIRISDPRWRNLTQPASFEVDAVLSALSQRSQAALTVYYEPPLMTVVMLFDGEVRCVQSTVASDLSAKLVDYARNLQKPQPDPFKHDPSSRELSIKAADLIPASVLARVLDAKSLIVVPHGLLHLVPWAALVHDGKRLFERLPVGLLPNLAFLAAGASQAIGKPHSIAMLGVSRYSVAGLPDLPSTAGEIEDVVSAYRDAGIRVRGPVVDAAATESAFWDLCKTVSGRGNALHLSCHGKIVPSEPMSSGLLLVDSKVDAAEIARETLPFDEAVLSACSTGWRPVQVGDVVLSADEILGIPGGFLEAGLRTVLVSIPKAEGKAARALTTHYHRKRVEGAAPLLALQCAQKQLLADGVEPGTWVGFTLYGCV
jgi:CHAT domain-containing protein/tetratricopeptide (TPR) repeat protein